MNIFIKKLSKKIIHNPIQFIILQLLITLIFALIYFFNEKWCRNNLDLAKKYNLINKEITQEKLNKIPEQNLIYYLWFSLITQTTVGYANMLPIDGQELFKLNKIINIFQLISIFVVIAYM